MQPISPVIPGMEEAEIVYAKDQPQYIPLPVLRTTNGQILARFKLTDIEKTRIEEGGDIYISIHTFNQPLQPFSLAIAKPDKELTKHNFSILEIFGMEG